MSDATSNVAKVDTDSEKGNIFKKDHITVFHFGVRRCLEFVYYYKRSNCVVSYLLCRLDLTVCLLGPVVLSLSCVLYAGRIGFQVVKAVRIWPTLSPYVRPPSTVNPRELT